MGPEQMQAVLMYDMMVEHGDVLAEPVLAQGGQSMASMKGWYPAAIIWKSQTMPLWHGQIMATRREWTTVSSP